MALEAEETYLLGIPTFRQVTGSKSSSQELLADLVQA